MNEPLEPLEQSAPLARRLARQFCVRDPATGESCAWIHGLWQYLRLMGLASAPDQHRDFYRAAFDTVAPRSGFAPDILISGAADYAMLAQVLEAFRARGLEPAVTVIDRCETPLALNRWFAERMNARVTTRRCEIQDMAGADAFDAICTHSLLSELSRPEREAVLEKWRELLRPGGRAILANRLRPSAVGTPVSFSEEQVRAYRDMVERKAVGFGADATAIAQDAERYARRRSAYPLRSLQEARELFESAGFALEKLAHVSLEQGTETGPTAPQGAEYAHVIAVRR
jgi:SAM-dependent methyltransferase